MYKLYLASKSPRRKQLLGLLRADFEIVDADIPEVPQAGEAAIDYVQRIALEKAMACRKSVPGNAAILAADTEVVLDDKILGKPSDMEAAITMLHSLGGREHKVMTAVVLLEKTPAVAVSVSRVWFRPLSLDECARYCNKFIPLDKAGAYGIQDQAAGFISRFEGSYTGVMGLPRVETAQLLSTLK